MELSKLRTSVIFFLFLPLYGIVIANLYVIQLKQASYFTHLGHNQYNVEITSRPARATIYDRHGVPLAFNITKTSAFVVPSKLSLNNRVYSFLKKYFPAAYQRIQGVQENKKSHFAYVKRHLTETQAQLIAENKLDEIYLLKEHSRFYPSSAVSNIIGVTDIDNKGLCGIEKIYDTLLAGKPSRFFLQQEARSGHYYFDRAARKTGNDGKPAKLTIDSVLQFLVHEELKDATLKLHSREAAALILDPTTGEIIVMSQYPSFDPNDHRSLDIQLTKNKIMTEAYELGSVIKVFFALAAFAENVIKPGDIVDCQNAESAFIEGFKINTVKPHGKITFSEVIEKSNNIGTSKVALRIGKALYDHYVKCGFGKKTDLYWPGQQRGFVNPPHRWSKRSIFSLSFGYELRATLLQLACAFSLLATDGYPITPKIVLDNKANNSNVSPVFNREVIETVREILKKTVTQGTALQAKINGYSVLGKTGTANLVVDGKYDKSKNIFTFTGLIEKGNYKRVLVTFIKESAKKDALASSTAVPLFEKIAHKMLIHDKVI